jgi:putative flippase GtrA
MGSLLTGLPGLFDVPGWWRAVFSRDPHPVLQFLRYGLAGVAAMAANVLFFALSDVFLFPVGDGETLAPPQRLSEVGRWLRDMGRNDQVRNYLKCNILAFFTANIVAYVLNFKWVFRSGRHSRRMEVFLFFLVSFVAFLVGTALASTLVGTFGINEYIAKSGDIVSAVFINYLCRKFLIFQG